MSNECTILNAVDLAWPNLVVSILLLLVTTGYLIATVKLLRHSIKSHKTGVELTRKLHADSLTPYIRPCAICGCVFLKSKKYPLLQIVYDTDMLSLSEHNVMVKVSENTYCVDDLQIIIMLSIYLTNHSKNPANIHASIQYQQMGVSKSAVISGISSWNSNWELCFPLNDYQSLENLLTNGICIKGVVIASGPGLSAVDTSEIQIKLQYSLEPKIVDVYDCSSVDIVENRKY